MSVQAARIARRVAAAAVATVVALSLVGCGVGDAARLAALGKQVAELPGVIEASSSYSPGGIDTPASSWLHVEVSPEMTVEQLARVTDIWAKGVDSSLRIAVHSTGSGPASSKTLTLERPAAGDPSVPEALPVWVALAANYERVSVDFTGWQWSLRVDTAAMTSPREAAATVEELSALVGPALAGAFWVVRPLSAATPDFEDEGVEVTSVEGVPDAAARAFLASLDDAFLAARSEGGVLLELTDRTSSDPAVGSDYRFGVTFWPPEIKDVPSNEINDMLLGTPTWNSALRFVDALVPTDRFTASFSIYGNNSFAVIFSDDCARSNDATNNPFGAELWSYWLADGATTADGSSASACS